MRWIAVAVLALLLSACVVPVNIIEPASPPLTGILYRSDGAPAAGARVALSNHPEDPDCSRPFARAITDTGGRFAFDPTTRRVRWILLVPPVERFFNAYNLCAARTDTALMFAYEGLVPLRSRGVQQRDSLSCIEWWWESRPNITCRGEYERDALQTGGSWTDGASSGWYRVIVARHRNARVVRRRLWRGVETEPPQVFVQWIQRTPDASRDSVRAIVSLPLAPRLISLERVSLRVERDKPARVILRSTGRPRSSWSLSSGRECAIIELRAPGEINRLGCP